MSHRRHTSLPKKKSYRSRCKDRRYESNSSSSSDFSRSRKSSVSRDSDNISLSDKEEQNFLSELQAVGQSINQNTSKQNSGNGNSNDNNTLSSESKKCLKDLFGEYASVKKTEKRIGLNLMTLRKKLLKTVYVPRHLVFYHVFLKRRKSGLFFPTSEETEEFLQVPPLDKLLESCLIKNYGAKGSFTKNNSRSLVTQPCKKIEHIAYKGQQASRMGIIMTSYVQQSLATLLDLLVEDNWDKDKVITNVKNVFAMTTQQLDQFGRTGAFHHIIRRTAAMTDSKLYELDDAIDLANIPLSGKGVFGPDFDTFLKDRKEKKKQIDEIIPDFKKKDNKRKLHSDTRSKVKKTRYDNQSSNDYQRQSSFTGFRDSFRNYRIPKKDDNKFNYKQGKSRFPTSTKKSVYSSSVKGRLGKSNDKRMDSGIGNLVNNIGRRIGTYGKTEERLPKDSSAEDWLIPLALFIGALIVVVVVVWVRWCISRNKYKNLKNNVVAVHWQPV